MADEFNDLRDGDTLDLQGTGFDTVDWVQDWDDTYGLLNYITYEITIACDLDGLYDELITIPLMANEQAGSILWVLMSSGFFQRIRLRATDYQYLQVAGDPEQVGTIHEPHGQQIHVRLAEATMYYQGQLS
jgi:hypothetical protein